MTLTPEQTAELIRRIKMAHSNLVAFRYLLLTNGKDEVDPPEFHFQWSDILLKEKDNFAIEGFRESLPLDTLIPTSKGFRLISELKIRDIVFNHLGKKTKVNYVSPIFNLKCYKIEFDDGTSQICSEDHLWRVNDKKKRKVRDVSTKEIVSDYKGWKHKNGYFERRFRIPICGCVQYAPKKLLVNPYILGFWLGDGTRNMAQFTIGNRDIKEISDIFKNRGFELNPQKSDKRGTHYSVLKLFVKLREIGVLKDKHIPVDYLQSSISQRLELLAGLIDSDGEVAKSKSKKGTVGFVSINETLAYNVLELVRSLGWKATIIRKESWFNKKRYNDHFLISFKPDKLVSKLVFKNNLLGNKDQRSCWKTITNVEEVKSIPTMCIGVDNKFGTYLITKDYIVTHNSGKGQIALRAFLLYCLRFPSEDRDYIVLIKQNATLAGNKLLEIENEYLTNPALNSNLIEVKQKSTEVFSVDIKDAEGKVHNIRIEAYGKGSSIRGLANVDRRPRICVLDDPQDTEDARSDTILDADWKWFLSDVMFLGKNTRIFLIGNNLGEKCIAERVFNAAEELGFQTRKVAILNEQGEPNWSEMFSLDRIEKEKEAYRRVGQIDVWMRERMCEATSEESRVFNKNDFIRYSYLYVDKIIKDTNIFFTVDGASSKDKSACYRAIVVNAVTEDNRWIIVDVPYGRWQSDVFIDELFKTVVKWHPYLGGVRRIPVGIEKGMFQQLLEPFIYKEMQRRNIYFDIVLLEHIAVGTKLERVKMLSPRFKAHSIMLPELSPWLAELETELMGVTTDGFKSLFVDLLDALAAQCQIAKPPIKGRADRQGGIEQVQGYDPLTGRYKEPATASPHYQPLGA